MKNKRQKLLLLTSCCWLFGKIALPAYAQSCGVEGQFQIEATVTADNHYKVVVGQKNPSQLQEIGRNEFGPFHIPDEIPPIPSEPCPIDTTFNWSCPESFSVSFPASDPSIGKEFYIYAFVWGESAVERSFLGDFQLSIFDVDNTPLYNSSLVTDEQWEVALVNNFNPGDFGDITLEEFASVIVDANNTDSWVSATSRGLNQDATLPWKRIPSIPSNAEFIASDIPGDDGDSIALRQLISEFPNPSAPCPVPEPSLLPALGVIVILSTASQLGRVFLVDSTKNI